MAELDILEKTREAFVYVLTQAVLAAPALNEKASSDKDAPYIGCGAGTASEEPALTGNFWVDAELVVKGIGARDVDGVDPKTTTDALAAAVLAVVEVDNLKDLLSAVPDLKYTVFGFGEQKEKEFSQEGDMWVFRWRRRLYCCGSEF